MKVKKYLAIVCLIAVVIFVVTSAIINYLKFRQHSSSTETIRRNPLSTEGSISNSISNSSVDLNSTSVSKSTSFSTIDPQTSFTVIVLPDTQNYSAKYPDTLCAQTQWIVDHKKDLNIVFVSQLGDIVNDGASKIKEWEDASKCLGKLDGVVPYSVIPGNHDLDTPHRKSSGFSMFDKYFPATKFRDNAWYGGNFENNRNNYERIEANGVSLLFLNLEIEPSDAALAWADSVVRQNPKAYTIVTTHKYLPMYFVLRDNSLDYSKNGNTGEQIWHKLIKDNCSISLVLSGHYHGENRIRSQNACGSKVDEIVQDYQDRPNGGDGWLRVYTFSPQAGKIQVQTYSPTLSKFEGDVDSSFSLPFNVR